MSREYCIHKRPNGIFYVQVRNPENGKLMTSKSTGKTERVDADDALRIVSTLKSIGLIDI